MVPTKLRCAKFKKDFSFFCPLYDQKTARRRVYTAILAREHPESLSQKHVYNQNNMKNAIQKTFNRSRFVKIFGIANSKNNFSRAIAAFQKLFTPRPHHLTSTVN